MLPGKDPVLDAFLLSILHRLHLRPPTREKKRNFTELFWKHTLKIKQAGNFDANRLEIIAASFMAKLHPALTPRTCIIDRVQACRLITSVHFQSQHETSAIEVLTAAELSCQSLVLTSI